MRTFVMCAALAMASVWLVPTASAQVRDVEIYYTFDGTGRLRLSTPPTEIGGRMLEYILLWERIPQ